MRLIRRLLEIVSLEKAVSAADVRGVLGPVPDETSRTRLPDRRPAVRQRMKWQDGQQNNHFADVSFGFDRQGAIREVFCLANKDGTDIQGLVHDACVNASIALQRGARIADLAKAMAELREEGQVIGRPASVMGYLLRLGAAVEQQVQGGEA